MEPNPGAGGRLATIEVEPSDLTPAMLVPVGDVALTAERLTPPGRGRRERMALNR